MEILVALFLVAIMFAVLMGGNLGGRDYLEESIDSIERAIRYASDEASLRNTIVRLNLKFDGASGDFTVEAGPGGSFVIPKNDLLGKKELSEEEKEELESRGKQLDRKFSPISAYSDAHSPLDEDVILQGVGASTTEAVVNENGWNIYFYPSGEKDDALIFISYDNRLVSLELSPFQNTYKREYYDIDLDVADIEEKMQQVMNEAFEKWQKN